MQTDITAPHTLANNHVYRIRLLPDEEILSKASYVYTAKLLKSRDFTLDSAIFGATIMNPICSICYQRVEECPGHYSVIQLPFPIVRSLCIKDFKLIITVICPVCSHFVIPNISDVLTLEPNSRLAWIRKETERYTKNYSQMVKCCCCENNVALIKIVQQEPQMRCCIERPNHNIMDQLIPTTLYNILQNFCQLEEIGYADTFHPKNFMTYMIVIVPCKIRPKTIMSSESTLTSYYKVIVDEICPELQNIYKTVSPTMHDVFEQNDILTNFNKLYDKLNSYYLLITDMGTERTKESELTLIEKRDRKHVDPHNSLMGRFKGKEKSIFGKGITYTRHNVSARTVLGGAVDSEIPCVNVPYHIASKLQMLYPVYRQNIKAMRQIVAAMNDPKVMSNVYVPHVIGIVNSYIGKQSKLHYKDALSRASMLKPGDRIAISLFNGDLVMQSRFPSIREESWTSLQVRKDNGSIVTIPLPICQMKTADFDGDEGQTYAASSHYTDVEALLLHSTYAQYIAYKDGAPAIWFQTSNDSPYGIEKITPDRKLIMHNGKYAKEYKAIDALAAILPRDLSYCDSKLEIRNGKLVSDKTKFMNVEFFKYFNSLYGPQIVERFVDQLVQLAYDINIDQGSTLGFDIRIYGDKQIKEIHEIMAATDRKVCELEESNDKDKQILEILAVESQKTKIKTLLIEGAKGTIIDKAGWTTLRQEEYYHNVIMTDYTIIDGKRIQNVLADDTRTCVAYSRHSVNPQAYGYNARGYSNDPTPTSTFYEAMQQRHAIFEKGQGTAIQGYMSKRLGVAYGNCYADFNGAVVNDFRTISTVYGNCGLNPRLSVKQPLVDIDLEPKAFAKKYNDKELISLHKKIYDYRSRYADTTLFISNSNMLEKEFIAGFNYEQYININAKKGNTDQKTIDKFISDIRSIYSPDASQHYTLENLITHEYYFRMKLTEYNCTQAIIDKLLEMFMWSLVDGGEPIGMKAALATSEPLTQASLHAIHSAGGGGVSEEKIVRSTGLNRFEELLCANKCKNSVLTFKLYNDSKEASTDFANEQETFYFKNIWSRMELNISKNVNDKLVALHPDIDFSKIDINPYSITMVWNLSIISSYNIHVVDIIDNLMKNYPEILFISGYILNSTEFMAHVYIKPIVELGAIRVMMEEWYMERTSTIIHGKYLTNCFVCENKNKPGHYLIQANEISSNVMAYQNLIFDPRVDPYGCSTTDIEITSKMYGIFEATAQHYENLIYTAINLSFTKGLLLRHYKVLSDMTFANGRPQYASRNSLKHDRTMDILRMLHFETAKDMMFQNLKFGDKQPITDPIAASTFAELPSLGTGVSKITLYPK